MRIGDAVEIVHLGTKGTVLSLPDRNGEVQIQAGILKMKAHLTQLKLVEAPKPKQSKVMTKTGAASRIVPMEVINRTDKTDYAMGEISMRENLLFWRTDK